MIAIGYDKFWDPVHSPDVDRGYIERKFSVGIFEEMLLKIQHIFWNLCKTLSIA